MTNQTVRVAFVGVDHPHGAGWRDTLAQLGDAVELTALVPAFGGAVHSLEERHAHLPRFASVEELLGRGAALFDAAVVCLPNDTGPAALCALAEAGKHVLAEKPAAARAGDLAPLQTVLARRAKRGEPVAFQSGYMWRYDAGANRLKEMIADGRCGKLISLEMSFVTSNVARRGPGHYLFDEKISGRGFFSWLACHFLDLLFYVTGERVVGVTSRVGCFGNTQAGVDDGGVAILDLSGGGIATFVGGYWLPRWTGESRWSIRGGERWVHWDPSRAGTGGIIETHGPQPQFYAMDEVFTLPVDKTPGYGGARNVALVSDWLAMIRDSAHRCRNSLRSTVATLELLDAIYAASSEGRRVTCDIGASGDD